LILLLTEAIDVVVGNAHPTKKLGAVGFRYRETQPTIAYNLLDK